MNIEIKIKGEELKRKLNLQDGKDYVLTAADKREIAKKIKVPVIEKIVEKTVVEKPVVKEVAAKDKPDEVVEKVNKAKKKIKAKQVEGLAALLKESDERGKFPVGKETGGGKNIRILAAGTEVSAHVTEINFADNITASYDGNGRVTLTAQSGVETPAETPDASRTIFTVLHTPIMVVSDGAIYFSGQGYSYATGTITMDIPPSQYIRSVY